LSRDSLAESVCEITTLLNSCVRAWRPKRDSYDLDLHKTLLREEEVEHNMP
jgi:hypothetical protein